MKPKARLYTFLSIILLLFIPSQLFKAQGSLLITDLEPLIARLDAGLVSGIITGSESFSNSCRLYYESEIELENWMLDTGSWSFDRQILKSVDFLSKQKEQEIILEKWMTIPVISADRLLNRYIIEEKEECMPLEDWMLSRQAWFRN